MRFVYRLIMALLAAGAMQAVAPVGVAFAASQPTATGLIPIADFAAMPTMRSPIVSPNGKRIAAKMAGDKKSRIAIIDADNPQAKPRIIGLGNVTVGDIYWAGNNRLLIEHVGTTFLFGGFYPLNRLIIVDLAKSNMILADPKSRGLLGADLLYVHPGGSWALLGSQNTPFVTPSVKRVDLATGEAIVVQKPLPDVWDWFVDDRGVLRGGVSYDEKRWKLYYRSGEAEPFRAIRGKFQKDDDSVDRFTFSRDGVTGGIVTNERTGRFGAYRYDFRTGTVGSTIFESPTADISDVLPDPDTGEIIGVRYHDDRWRTFWADPELKSLQAKLDKALPGRDNLILQPSSAADRILIWSSGASEPGTYFLLDRKTSKMNAVLQPYERIDPATLASVQPVSYAARDGLTIPAYLTVPRGSEARSLPLIVMPHGGPFSRDEWIYDPLVQFLANRGYAVLQPQFRGSTGYGKDYVARGYGEWGRKMQDDLDDGVDWLARSGKIDPRRVCIVGGSYGGYAALWGAIRNPERYRCAASVAGVTDLGIQLKNNRKSFSATRYFRQWRTKVQGEGKFDLRTVSPLSHAERLKVPVLIAHGEADDTVSPDQGHKMVEALEAAKANVTSVFYKDGGHNLSNSEDLADFLKRLETFLNQHNPATPAAGR